MQGKGRHYGGCKSRDLQELDRRCIVDGHWQDPEFDPQERAFYYVCVIEIPTPRWTAYDVARFGIEMSDKIAMTIQDRAYVSPIWYTP